MRKLGAVSRSNGKRGGPPSGSVPVAYANVPHQCGPLQGPRWEAVRTRSERADGWSLNVNRPVTDSETGSVRYPGATQCDTPSPSRLRQEKETVTEINYVELLDALHVKIRLARTAPAVAVSSRKCMMNDEPLTARHKVAPVPGSVRQSVAGQLKGEAIKHADQSGECPLCNAFVPLSTKGYVTAHMRHNAPTPAPVALSEPSVAPTDMGARIGDPSDGMQRRAVDIDGAFQRGTVQLPVKGEKGRTKLEDVPATLENVRASFKYWLGRKPRSDSGKAQQTEMVVKLSRWVKALEAGQEAVHADQSPEGRTTQMAPGPALVRGREVKPFAGEVTVRKVGEEYTRPAPAEDKRRGKAGTMAGPLGRPRFDRGAVEVPADKPKRTPAQRARYRRQQRLAAQLSRQSNKG